MTNEEMAELHRAAHETGVVLSAQIRKQIEASQAFIAAYDAARATS